MSGESAAYNALVNDTYVNGIVGTRVYPNYVPEKISLPAIAIQRTSTTLEATIHSNIPVLSLPAYEVVCMVNTNLEDAETLADLTQTALAGASFRILDRRADFDEDLRIWATVIAVDYTGS